MRPRSVFAFRRPKTHWIAQKRPVKAFYIPTKQCIISKIKWGNPLDINIYVWTMVSSMVIYSICFLLASTQSIVMWNLAHTNGHKKDEIKLHLKQQLG